MTLASRALSLCTVTALAVGGALLLPASASAAGVGDASSAVLYGPSGPLGTLLDPLSDDDDNEQTIALPFDLNFFGTESTALCITTNGLVAPVPTTADGCGTDYDVDLENYALDNQVSVIGALLADNDPSEAVWKDEGAAIITGYSVASQIVTFTTSTAHGLTVGDEVDLYLGHSALLSTSQSGTVAAVPTPTSFQFDWNGSGIPDWPQTAVEGVIGDAYGSHESDGFGVPGSIYAGPTTVDGKPAFAVTWYRVATNEDDNGPWLTNTFQIVLVQEPSGGADGSDFTVQFNFGTLADLQDGYDAANPNQSCDESELTDCRWSVGLARYDADTDTVEEFEFFADYPITDIGDTGATPLVANSLNSDVLGRYLLGMFDGEVVGFAIPDLRGSAAAPTLANTGGEPALILVPAAALALLVGAGVLVLRRRTA